MEDVLWTNGEIVVKNNELWFSSLEHNICVKYDLKNANVSKCFCGNEILCWKMSSISVVSYKDSIVKVPFKDSYIHMIKNDMVNSILVDRDIVEEERSHCAIELDQKLYLFPYMSDYIYVIDNNNIRHIECDKKKIVSIVAVNSDIFLANNSSILWKFDSMTGKISGFLEIACETICWCGFFNNSLYFATKEKGLYVVENKEPKLLNVSFYGDYIENIAKYDHKLYIFLRKNSKAIYVYNLLTKELYKLVVFEEESPTDWKYNSFGKPEIWNNKIYVMSPTYRELVSIDLLNDEVDKKFIFFNELDCEIESTVYEQLTHHNKMISENNVITLKGFLNSII